MALAAEARKDYPRAVWMLELALKKDPKEGLFHYELGRIHWELGNDSDAIKHLRLASELNPTLTSAHWVMGELALQNQEYSAAERYFQAALKNDDKHLPSLLSLASMKVNSKDYARAEEYLTRAIALEPHVSKTRLVLGEVQAEHLKKYEEALSTYKQLRQLNAEKKLDESVHMNLDEKIKSLQKNITQAKATKPTEITVRTPSGERKVAE